MGLKSVDFFNKVKTGNQETESLGRELAEKARTIKEGQAVPTTTPEVSKPLAKPAPVDLVNRPPRKPRPRLDIRDALKPLGSFKEGTSNVPETGMYELHKGEAVIPKEMNTMDAKTAMAGITGKAKPAKKIHKIITHKTDDGKMIHTHLHHHPHHHPDETHVSNNIADAQSHMAAMEPNMSAQAPEMPEAPAGPMPGM